RSLFGPQRWPVAATYTTSGFRGSMTIRAMWCVSSNPIRVQDFPASVDLYTPLPQDDDCRLFDSPVPTHTTFSSEGAIATSPMGGVDCASKRDSQVVPRLTDLNSPPVAVATYTMLGFPGTHSMSSMRPPMIDGPILRHGKPSTSDFTFSSPGAAKAA